MSDVSKTNELIAELRRSPSIDVQTVIDLMAQAADALEAATREQGSAGDIRRAVRLWSERFIPGDRWDAENARDLGAALKCVVEANPDRSRARVPVQGEPNDDREALAQVLFGAENTRDWVGWELLTDVAREAYLEVAEIVLEAGFSRATVPDAATAAVDRVRAAVEKHKHWNEDCGWDVPAIEAIAALDGAPEPEWEWGYRGETLIDVHTRKSRESAEGAVKALTEYWALHGKKIEVVRRRKAGPWLPVEGESGANH